MRTSLNPIFVLIITSDTMVESLLFLRMADYILKVWVIFFRCVVFILMLCALSLSVLHITSSGYYVQRLTDPVHMQKPLMAFTFGTAVLPRAQILDILLEDPEYLIIKNDEKHVV